MTHTLPSLWDYLSPVAPAALAGRRYGNVPGGHASPRGIMAALTLPLRWDAEHRRGGGPGAEANIVQAAVSMACGRHGWPIIWVDRHLLEAVARTDPPADMRLDAIRWPFEGLALALPLGTLRHGRDGDCSWMALARLAGDLRCPLTGAVTRVGSPSVGCYTASLTVPAPAFLRLSLSEDAVLGEAGGLEFTDMHGDDPGAPPDPHPDDGALIKAAFGLGVRILLALTARPEYLEADSRDPRRPAGGNGWTPVRWAGRGHRHTVHGAEAGAGGPGVRLHWRRGHFRSQPCGEGRGQRRVIWLEPALVGGGQPPSQ